LGTQHRTHEEPTQECVGNQRRAHNKVIVHQQQPSIPAQTRKLPGLEHPASAI